MRAHARLAKGQEHVLSRSLNTYEDVASCLSVTLCQIREVLTQYAAYRDAKALDN